MLFISWSLTDSDGLCGYIILYQVYLKDVKKLDPSAGNPSYYQNASDNDIKTFKNEFCSFLEEGSRGFFREDSNSMERELGNRILKAIDIIRETAIADIPSLKFSKKNWMDVG